MSFLKEQSCHQKGLSEYMAGNTTPLDTAEGFIFQTKGMRSIFMMLPAI